MIKYFIILKICLLSYIANAQDSLIIDGYIDKRMNDQLISISVIYHFQYENDKPKIVDTCKVVDGRFHFQLPVNTTEKYVVELLCDSIRRKLNEGKVVERKFTTLFLEPKYTKIIFKDTLLKDYEVVGNESNKKFIGLLPLLNQQLFAPDEIKYNLLQWLKTEGNNTSTPSVIFSLIKKIPDDQIRDLYNNLPDSLKKNSDAKDIAYYINNLTVGHFPPDFKQLTDGGVIFNLKDLRGKVILLEFWASWCLPCRAETPYLKQAYRRYKKSNFTILSISLDDKKEKWIKAIKDEEMPWLQVSDLKGWDNEVSRYKYKIRAIPANILIGEDGKILAKNLSGQNLILKLKEVFRE